MHVAGRGQCASFPTLPAIGRLFPEVQLARLLPDHLMQAAGEIGSSTETLDQLEVLVTLHLCYTGNFFQFLAGIVGVLLYHPTILQMSFTDFKAVINSLKTKQIFTREEFLTHLTSQTFSFNEDDFKTLVRSMDLAFDMQLLMIKGRFMVSKELLVLFWFLDFFKLDRYLSVLQNMLSPPRKDLNFKVLAAKLHYNMKCNKRRMRRNFENNPAI